MQTSFSKAQLDDPEIAQADRILRRCVHCGLCTATCPTYVVLGDERDSPRGRIYAIKDMLEKGIDARPEISTHIDRCLSCFSCMTTCPSGVDYMHLVEIARGHIEKTGGRSLKDRLMRRALTTIVPYPRRFRWAMRAAPLGRRLTGALRAFRLHELAAMVDLAPVEQAAWRTISRTRNGDAERRADGARHSARGLRAAGSEAADQRRDDPAFRTRRHRCDRRAGRRLLRGAEPAHRPRRMRRSRRPRSTSMPGARKLPRAASTRSSSIRRAAARRSRTTVICWHDDPEPTPSAPRTYRQWQGT